MLLDKSTRLSYGSVKNCSRDIQMEPIRVNVEQRVLPALFFLCYHRGIEHAGNAEIGVVTHRRIRMQYSCFVSWRARAGE